VKERCGWGMSVSGYHSHNGRGLSGLTPFSEQACSYSPHISLSLLATTRSDDYLLTKVY